MSCCNMCRLSTYTASNASDAVPMSVSDEYAEREESERCDICDGVTVDSEHAAARNYEPAM